MSDDSLDAWKSLASELGVDPNAVPPPPPPPTPPPAASSSVTSSPAPLEQKKTPSNWSALASDLGIEVPPEPETPIARKDPVAELLGWPQQSRQAESRDAEARRPEDFEERQPWDREDVRGRWGDEEEKPLEEGEAESESRSGQRTERGDREDGEQRGRRRRGGRGRGRRGDSRERGVSDREERRPMAEGYRDEVRDLGDEADEIDRVEPAADFGESDDLIRQRADDEEEKRRPRRRRGRRRGRGGERTGAERRPREIERKSEGASADRAFDEPDIVPFAEEIEDLVEIERAGALAGEEFAEVGVTEHDASDRDDDDDDDEPRGKSSVRDILTWKEAIGIIINTNMQERSRNPRPGGNGGRGRRGGGRRNG